MKVLVYPVRLAIGGAQINAVDLAAGVRDLGHDVMVFSRPGPLLDLVMARDLRYVSAPLPGPFRPSPRIALELRRLVRRERIDVVHAWGPNPCLEAFYGAHLLAGVPAVGSFMDMSFVEHLPKSMPLVVGTREVLEEARRQRPGRVELIEPPIDTEADNPAVDGSPFRDRHGIAPTELLLVVVSRLAHKLKLDSIALAIETSALLAPEFPVRLAVVGDGRARAEVERRAEDANRGAGRELVILTGHLVDPRPAYAAADVILGMGSSVLRGMAFEKPAIVLGELGFSKVVAPETADWFLFHGFYGVGEGDRSATLTADQLEELLKDEARRRDLGRFARRLVCDRFSIRAASARLDVLYREATRCPRGLESVADGLGTTLRVGVEKMRGRGARQVARHRRKVAT